MAGQFFGHEQDLGELAADYNEDYLQNGNFELKTELEEENHCPDRDPQGCPCCGKRPCRCKKPPDLLSGKGEGLDAYFLAMLSPSGGNGIMVDSGAALNACPPEHAETNAIRRVPHVKATTATGEAAEHHGEKTVEYEFDDGTKGSITYQVMNVSRPVLSVSEMNARGHTVVFEPKGAYIVKSGKRLDLWRRDGVFYLTGKILNEWSSARIIADLETGESQDARAPALPELPSKREQELQDLTHLPWRPWCRFCVQGKAKDDPHRKVVVSPGGLPEIQIDFF